MPAVLAVIEKVSELNTVKRKIVLALALMLTCASIIVAQTPVHVQKVKMSMPFGEIKGKLLIVEDLLIFVDDDNRDSLALDRDMVARIEAMDKELFVETVEPIRDRIGSRTRLAFRLENKETAPIMAWFESRPRGRTVADLAAAAGRPVEERTSLRVYDAKHKHFIGSCEGKLVVSENMISYESFTNRSHSRQYPFRDIKRLKRNGPYELEVQTYNRGSYKLELQGSGMDIADYKFLEQSIAAAKASR